MRRFRSIALSVALGAIALASATFRGNEANAANGLVAGWINVCLPGRLRRRLVRLTQRSNSPMSRWSGPATRFGRAILLSAVPAVPADPVDDVAPGNGRVGGSSSAPCDGVGCTCCGDLGNGIPRRVPFQRWNDESAGPHGSDWQTVNLWRITAGGPRQCPRCSHGPARYEGAVRGRS